MFGASIGLWWAFENVMDVVPYVADALPMRLHLINGVTGAESPYGFHDWNFILGETGLLWAAWSLWYYWFVQRSMVKDQIYD